MVEGNERNIIHMIFKHYQADYPRFSNRWIYTGGDSINMTKLIIVGRDRLAESLLECAEKHSGRQTGVYPLDAKPGDSGVIFAREFEFLLDNLQGDKLVLLDADRGPHPSLYRRYCWRPDIKFVCGVNLRMLLDILRLRQRGLELNTLAAVAVCRGRRSIRTM